MKIGIGKQKIAGKSLTHKAVLAVIAISMLAQFSKADGGPRLERAQPRTSPSATADASTNLSLGEFFCGLAGGTATGVFLRKAGAADPVTFIGALIGGVIGYKFCQYLNDDEARGLNNAARTGLDGRMCQETRWSGGKYHGTLEVLAESTHSAGIGEASQGFTCKMFETTIFEKPNRYVGRSKAWACNRDVGSWVITDERWVSKQDVRYCRSTGLPGSGGGSVSIGDGRVAPPVSVEAGRIRGFWSLEQFRRRVMDYGIERGLKLAVRTEFGGEVEVGLMKALSDDGRGVIVYMSPTYQRVVNIDQVGIECRHSRLCYDTQVQTTDGLSGTLQYVFNNGDVVVNDPMNGIQLRPGRMLR